LCVSYAHEEHKFVLLRAFISCHEVRLNTKESIAYRLSIKEVKTACLKDFVKQLEYSVLKESETKIVGINV
jgi:hypothetical protein